MSLSTIYCRKIVQNSFVLDSQLQYIPITPIPIVDYNRMKLKFIELCTMLGDAYRTWIYCKLTAANSNRFKGLRIIYQLSHCYFGLCFSVPRRWHNFELCWFFFFVTVTCVTEIQIKIWMVDDNFHLLLMF